MTPPPRRETQVEVPDHPPYLNGGAARELARILRAAAEDRTVKLDNDHSGEEPEAIAS